MTKKLYTQKEIDYIIKHPNDTIGNIAKALGRTNNSVKKKLDRMRKEGLIVRGEYECKPFSNKEKAFILSNLEMKSTEMADYLNRPYRSIYSKRMELTPNFKRHRKSDDNFKAVISFCKSKGLTVQQAIKHYGSVREFKRVVKL